MKRMRIRTWLAAMLMLLCSCAVYAYDFYSEGVFYVITSETEKTVAIFSHGGSSSVALSHILNIPFPQICGIFHPDFTSITVVEFSDKIGELFCPVLLLLNDARHIEGLDSKKTYEE